MVVEVGDVNRPSLAYLNGDFLDFLHGRALLWTPVTLDRAPAIFGNLPADAFRDDTAHQNLLSKV